MLPLLAVSDGSVKDDCMTYGWLVGTSSGEKLAQHSGPGYGVATSHRAEAWGMLSAALFLSHLHQFNNEPSGFPTESLPIIFISDNSSLVTRVNQRMTYREPYPNSTLKPDWDIVEQIYQVLQKAPYLNATVDWIKGHQDDITDDLTVPARFNVAADALADTAHSCVMDHQDPILLPAGKCSLFIKDVMIQSHFQSIIRDTYTLPPYKSYIARRHGWPDPILQEVDWASLHRALRSTEANHVQMVKFLHDKLPTNYELAKSNPSHPKECPFCSHVGTFTHLLQCQSTISATFRTNLKASLLQLMKAHNLPLAFQSKLVHSKDNSVDNTLASPYQRSPTGCLKSQHLMGPQAVMKGFLSLEWQRFLSRHTAMYTGTSPSPTTDIISAIIRLLWQEQFELWKLYLQSQNPSSPSQFSQLTTRHQYYQNRIRKLFSQRHNCLPGHRDQFFPKNMETYLAQSTTTQLRQYLHHYEDAIHHSIRAAKQQSLKPLTRFPGFFRRRIQSPTTPLAPQSTNSTVTRLFQFQGVRGTPSHHKHTRWRPLTLQLQSIRKYFHPKSHND